MVRLAAPSIDDEDVEAVARVLRTGFLVQGPQVEQFEAVIRERTGAGHAVAVGNCTTALHLSLIGLGIGPDDAVAVPAYSWPATINVVALVGARPVIVDIDPRTYNMDPGALAEVLKRERVSAVIPVHAFGGMADMETIASVAAEHGAVVLEDAACALGAVLNGKQAGRFGAAGCFSFHPRKAVTTGEGGVVVTDDANLANQLRSLRNHGLDAEGQFVLPGYNARMTDFQAALGLTQMAKLDHLIERRRQLAATYESLLDGSPIETTSSIPGACHVYQSYVVLLPKSCAAFRPSIIGGMRGAGIETTIGTYALPFIKWVRERYGYRPDDFPVVHEVAARALSLPMHEHLTEEDQQRVVDTLLQRIKQCFID